MLGVRGFANALVGLGLCTACGGATSSAALRHAVASDIVPLKSSLGVDPETALVCGTVKENGDVSTALCPSVLGKLFKYDFKEEQRPQGSDYAIYKVNGRALFPAFQGKLEVNYANERVWYGGWSLTPISQAPTTTDVESLRDMCGVDRESFDAVVQKVEYGCSLTHFGTEANAGQVVWSVEALATNGNRIGDGQFRSANLQKEAFTPECTVRAPIAIHLLSRKEFCANYVTPVMIRTLFERVETLKKDSDASRSELEVAKVRTANDKEKIAALETALDTLVKQKSANEADLRALDQKVTALKATNEQQTAQIVITERRLDERERELRAATKELVEVLREKAAVNQAPKVPVASADAQSQVPQVALPPG
jgi:hypothetical protein